MKGRERERAGTGSESPKSLRVLSNGTEPTSDDWRVTSVMNAEDSVAGTEWDSEGDRVTGRGGWEWREALGFCCEVSEK